MTFKTWHKMYFSLAAALCLFAEKEAFAAGLNYEAYLESWDSNWQNVVQNLPPGLGGTSANSYNGVILDVAFACYNVSAAPTPAGLQFLPADLSTVVNFVHSHGGKVKISFGGASYAPCPTSSYFISQTPGWPGNASTLAAGVVSIVTGNNLDGVDFDIEDAQPGGTTAQQFAADLIAFLKDVRSGLPAGKILSLTIPAQGWNGTYWYYLATGVAAVPGLVDYINFMEYDIWTGVPYVQQIEADLLTYTSSPDTKAPPNYSPGWGIPPGLIQLGLMPGCDDSLTIQFLSTEDAEGLATKATTLGLYGVMIWDLNRDVGTGTNPPCATYPSGYEYSITIRNALAGMINHTHPMYSPYPSRFRKIVLQNFEQQPPPPHGSP